MRKAVFPKGNSQYINKLNKIKILNIIRENGKISRAEISRKSEISAPTVTRIVNTLIQDEGLVREVGDGESSGGRPPKLIEFAGDDNFVIGVDLGTTHIYGVLSNLNAKIVAKVKQETHVEDGFEKVIERTANIICELQNHPTVKKKKIFGIGMAVAGLIDRKKAIVEYSPDFHWENANIVKYLRQKCGLPIIFDNVTRVMGLGELWYGIGKEIKNFIIINIGYGIGASVINEGRPIYGYRGMAGEFGHVILDRDSKYKCECGNYGCLEALASGRAIALKAREGLEGKAKSILVDMVNGDLSKITTEMVANAARQGDPFASKIFYDSAQYIGIGVAGLVNLFNPQAVVIGGGVSQAGELLFDVVRETVNQRALKNITKDLIIIPATFGLNAAVMGSVALILNEILHLDYQSYSKKLAVQSTW